MKDKIAEEKIVELIHIFEYENKRKPKEILVSKHIFKTLRREHEQPTAKVILINGIEVYTHHTYSGVRLR